ncbi:MAG: hypothetical protein ACKN9T_00430 [Candidatus Methylumidiphilus sp.]
MPLPIKATKLPAIAMPFAGEVYGNRRVAHRFGEQAGRHPADPNGDLGVLQHSNTLHSPA